LAAASFVTLIGRPKQVGRKVVSYLSPGARLPASPTGAAGAAGDAGAAGAAGDFFKKPSILI
jgi:hypothetical protein